MPRRTDEREKTPFSPAEELRGGALAPLDALDTNRAMRAPIIAALANAPREEDRETAPGPRWWTRVMLGVGVGGALLVGATRVAVERFFGRAPFEMPSFVAQLFLIAFGLVGLAVALVSFLEDKTTSEAELARTRARPRWWVSAFPVLMILMMIMRTAWQRREAEPERDPSVTIEELRWRAAARPYHVQSQLALGAAEHEAGRYEQAEAPLARARDLTGGDGFVHPTDQSLEQPEFTKHVQALYAVNHAHLVPPKQSLAYYNAAYTLGDRSKEVYRGLAEAWMARAGYWQAAQIAQEYIATIESDPELVKLRDAALRIEWDRQQGTTDDVAPGPVSWPDARSAEQVAAEKAVIEARLSARQRKSWDEARLGFASLQDALTTYGERMDWQSGRMLAGTDAAGKLDDARRHTLRAIALAPNAAQYRLQLGMIHTLQGEYGSAIDAFDAAQHVDPRVLERYPSFAHLRRFVVDRAAVRNQVYLRELTLVAPPPPDARPSVP